MAVATHVTGEQSLHVGWSGATSTVFIECGSCRLQLSLTEATRLSKDVQAAISEATKRLAGGSPA